VFSRCFLNEYVEGEFLSSSGRSFHMFAPMYRIDFKPFCRLFVWVRKTPPRWECLAWYEWLEYRTVHRNTSKILVRWGLSKILRVQPPQKPPVVPSLLEVSIALGCNRRQGCHQIREFKENQGILFSNRENQGVMRDFLENQRAFKFLIVAFRSSDFLLAQPCIQLSVIVAKFYPF